MSILSLLGLRRFRDGRMPVALEDLSPPRSHRPAQALRGLAEALEVSVLEVDARQLRPEQGERHLDLGDELRVVLEPLVELPGQHQPPWRGPLQHLTPPPLAALLPPLVPAA